MARGWLARPFVQVQAGSQLDMQLARAESQRGPEPGPWPSTSTRHRVAFSAYHRQRGGGFMWPSALTPSLRGLPSS